MPLSAELALVLVPALTLAATTFLVGVGAERWRCRRGRLRRFRRAAARTQGRGAGRDLDDAVLELLASAAPIGNRRLPGAVPGIDPVDGA